MLGKKKSDTIATLYLCFLFSMLANGDSSDFFAVNLGEMKGEVAGNVDCSFEFPVDGIEDVDFAKIPPYERVLLCLKAEFVVGDCCGFVEEVATDTLEDKSKSWRLGKVNTLRIPSDGAFQLSDSFESGNSGASTDAIGEDGKNGCVCFSIHPKRSFC
jgi:hypothetical protein